MNAFQSEKPSVEYPESGLAKPLILKTGTIIRNRIAKAAMHESMGDKHDEVSHVLVLFRFAVQNRCLTCQHETLQNTRTVHFTRKDIEFPRIKPYY